MNPYCHKQAYNSKATALAEIARGKRLKPGKKRLRRAAVFCPVCDAWHLIRSH